MHNDNLDDSIRAVMGDAHATPAAQAAINGAFAVIAREAEQRPVAAATARRRPAFFPPASRWARAAAVTCAVCLGVGGTAYAADALGLIDLRQSGTYQTMMAVDAGDDAGTAHAVADYRLAFSGLPDGATADDSDDYLAKYHWGEGADEKGFSAFLYYLDTSDPLPVSSTTGSTPVTAAGAEGVVFEKPDAYNNATSRDMYLVFPDKQRVLWLWTDTLSTEELIAVADGITLEPTGTTVVPGQYDAGALSTLEVWSAEVAAESDCVEGSGESFDAKLTATAEEVGPLHAVGDTVPVPCYANEFWSDRGATESPLAATVTAVTVHDDLTALDPAAIPEEWPSLLTDGGTLGNAEIRHVAFGDGRDSINTVVATESVPAKLVEATVEYRNTGDTELTDALVYMLLVRATENEGTWSIFNRANTVEGSDEAVCSVPGVTYGELYYHSIDKAHRGEKNHLSRLAPGETATVQFAWLVPADELDKLLLAPAGGSDYQFNEEDLACGYVDIRS